MESVEHLNKPRGLKYGNVGNTRENRATVTSIRRHLEFSPALGSTWLVVCLRIEMYTNSSELQNKIEDLGGSVVQLVNRF